MLGKDLYKKILKPKQQSGFTLLMAIVVTSMLLLVSFVVANIALKQLVLAYTSQESQFAFYNADSGIECAQYWDLKAASQSAFSTSTTGTITCGNQTITTNSQVVSTIPPEFSQIGGGGGTSGPEALVDAGGTVPYTNSEGTWTDAGFVGGAQFERINPISGTSDDELYQTERYGDFHYIVSGFTPGSNHTVILKFAELYIIWAGGQGGRIFNVDINGTTVLNDYDIYADAGGPYAAVDKTFVVAADGAGTIDIHVYSGPGGVGSPVLNAFEIKGMSGGGSSDSIFQVDFTHGCSIVKVSKSYSGPTLLTTIESRGYNTCNTSSDRRYERGIKITY